MKGATKRNLGLKLKRLRNQVHMEQEIVSRVLNIPRTAITAFEKGERDLTVFEMVDLCKLYRISPNDLLGWGDKTEADHD